MTAIILAAGQGRRLRPMTQRLPKCLVPVGGTPILTHTLDRIRRAGLTEVLLVVGFEGEQVRRHVNRLTFPGLRVRFVTNERFAETNNLYSLWLALGEVSGPATIVNGDDLFNLGILGALQRDPAEAAASVDFTRPLAPDAMRVALMGSRVACLCKALPDRVVSGNAIGLYRFSGQTLALLRDEIARWVESGRVNDFYVSAISALAARVAIRAVSTEGLTWCEVDDLQDLAAAPAKLARILTEEHRRPRVTALRWRPARPGTLWWNDARPSRRVTLVQMACEHAT